MAELKTNLKTDNDKKSESIDKTLNMSSNNNSKALKNPKILYLSFNQEYNCISCGTTQGFVIYNIDPFKIRYQQNFGKGIGIAEIFYTSNLIGLVGGGDDPKFPTNKLVIWDDYQSKKIAEIDTEHRILGVQFNKECLAVVCQNFVKFYQFKDVSFLKKVETCDNPNGVCALSTCETSTIAVVPADKPGFVNIVNYASGSVKTMKCHDNPIHRISLNKDSTKFATCSVQGTLVRVFDLPTQTKFRELRRGSDACDIYGIHFSKNSKCMAVTSNRNTVHIFSLCKEYKNTSSKLRTLGVVSGFFNSEWSLFSLPWELHNDDKSDTSSETSTSTFNSNNEERHLCAIPIWDENQDSYKIFIVGYNGDFETYEFKFNPDKIEKLRSGSLFQLDTILPVEIPKK